MAEKKLSIKGDNDLMEHKTSDEKTTYMSPTRILQDESEDDLEVMVGKKLKIYHQMIKFGNQKGTTSSVKGIQFSSSNAFEAFITRATEGL